MVVQTIELRYMLLNHNILESYAKRIPFETMATLHGLDDDSRLGLVIAILDHGKMTFSEMQAKFEMNSSILSNHLSILQEGNLIQNSYEKKNNRVSSYYDVTDIVESMLHAILDVSFNNSNNKYTKSSTDKPLENFITLTENIAHSKIYCSKEHADINFETHGDTNRGYRGT